MTTSVITLTSKFTDGTSRKVSIGTIETSKLNPNIKTAIKNLNDEEKREASYPGFTNGYVSDSGAPFAYISAAEIVTTRREVIF